MFAIRLTLIWYVLYSLSTFMQERYPDELNLFKQIWSQNYKKAIDFIEEISSHSFVGYEFENRGRSTTSNHKQVIDSNRAVLQNLILPILAKTEPAQLERF